MNLRELFKENIDRTGESKSAVVGWGRGMGHRGHMYLADAVITQAEETDADPYFVVSRTIGKDDPITPEEKLHLYKKVFPKMEHIFHAASDELPDLNRVLKHLASLGYTDVTVVVGADQKNAFQYLVRPDKSGVEPYKQFGFNSMNVISRQETNSKYSQEEGPRATPMRNVLNDPEANDDKKFQTWRDAMSPEVGDDEVRDLMHKAHTRMNDPTFGKKKKEKAAAEGLLGLLSKAPVAKTTSVSRVPSPLKPGEMPPDIKMLINKVQNKVPLRPDEYAKLQAYKAFKDADSMSLKEANMLARALREGSAGKVGKGGTKTIDKQKKSAMRNATTIPGLNMSTGSQYMNYRMGIALAGAPDYPTKMEADNWIGGDPLISSYTQEEYDMVKAAALQVGAGTIENWSGKRSEEMADVNKTSTVATPKKNKYGI
jgi:hypothetical protein